MASEPEDLGVRIGSKKQKSYEDLLKKLDSDHNDLILQLEVNDALQEFCRAKIIVEKEMFK